AAAELHRGVERRAGRRDPRHRLEVLAPAGERAVEIDHVDTPRALAREPRRHLPGTVGVDRGLLALALAEAHRLAAEQVDRGDDAHRQPFQLRKRSSSARPASWLFSGWNCTANTF